MRTAMLSIRVTTAAAAVAALLAGTALTAASSASAAAASPTGGPGRWSQVTPNGTETFADIGLARGGHGVLNVIWASGLTSAGHAKIMDTPISSGGAVGRPATIVSGYYLITHPDACSG